MSDEEIVKLITQIANNFGISCDDASYIIKSFENFGKEFMMSEADKMFEELGYKKILIKRNFGCIYEYEKADKIISFYNNKTFAIYNYIDSFEYCNMQELQAINQKCKELGWIE